jgi:uncharacterized protein (DUF2062 family)
MREFFRKRLINPIVALLTQGITVEKIALSIVVGAVVGIFPVLGTTTVLCTLVAVALRLNLIAVQTVHYAMTPVQLVMIIPFTRVGEHVVGAAPQPLSLQAGLDLIAQGALQAVVILWSAIWHAMVGWVVLAPFVMTVGYFVLRWILARLRFTGRSPAGVTPPSSVATSNGPLE